MKRYLISIFVICFISHQVYSQYIINGQIKDAESGLPIANVHVITSNKLKGTSTDQSGWFSLNLADKKGSLTIKALGYEQYKIPYQVSQTHHTLDTIYLVPSSYNLEETVISAGLSKQEITPVAVSQIEGKTIRENLGDQPLPLILNNTPGVYSIRYGGGSGDADLIIRGFNQENVNILLNGIPINGVENGLVYWSNWLGLAQTASKIQIQKGPGLANLGNSAVGGSVNIITHNSDNNKSGTLTYQVTSYGNQQLSFALNSGKMNNGWDISIMGSYSYGPGYVDATYVNAWSYFLSMNKILNSKNKISFTLMGAPQKHGQRTLYLTNEEFQLHGNKFNKDWGSYNGKINNASENFYHKPFFSANHYLNISSDKILTNILYVSYGNGGGKWSESFNYAPTIFSYRNPSGQIDWDEIYNINANNEETYTLNTGETVSGYSLNVQTHFLASHIVAGYTSSYEQKLWNYFDLTAGVHYRYFNSYLREEIIDLLGGAFFIDNYSWAVDGNAGRPEVKTVGDIIKVDNNSIINYMNAYAQLLFKNKNINAYVSLNLNNNWYKRIDRYNYVENQTSETVVKPGFDSRTGVSYQINPQQKLYVNAAYISRAPYFKYVFGNFNNQPVQNLKNENIQTIEAGYEIKGWRWYFTAAAFYTNWQNVSILTNEYIQLEGNEQTRAMINGLNALHKGIEMETSIKITEKLSAGGILSFGNYKWTNNVTAQLFNDDNIVVDTVQVIAKGLYVGGTAQQQYGAFINSEILNFFKLRAEYLFYNQIYANFEPTSRANPADQQQPYEIPGYGTLNIYLGIPFSLFKSNATFQINGYNLLNSTHIINGEDGIDHDLATFRGFWSFGRNFEFSLRLKF